MASSVSYVDLDGSNAEQLDSYALKSKRNLEIFQNIFFGNPLAYHATSMFKDFSSENLELLDKICEVSGVSRPDTRVINVADELLNLSQIGKRDFGCTSVGTRGVIGQNLDLYDVELSVVREGGALYITMPPYLALMGMNEKIAFCTNHIFSEVIFGGMPVSDIRRNLLRKNSLSDVKDFLEGTKRTTSVNFLVSDGCNIIDFECSPEGVRTLDQVLYRNNRFNAHTNHKIKADIRTDYFCSRLERAVEMFGKGAKIEEILDDSKIHVPLGGELGFGTIIKVVMDVKNRIIKYKDPKMEDYETIVF